MTYEFKWAKPALPQIIDKNGMAVGETVEDWSARPYPPKQSIQGKYCSVEPFNLEKHNEALFEAFSLDKDARNWAYLPYGPFKTSEQFKTWCEQNCAEDDPLFHTIIDNKTSKPTGLASYLRITPEIGSIEIGHIHFSPLMQQTRLSTESMYLMMCRVFDELGYRRYEWKCNALNTPSCAAAERFGFQFEGIFRQATISKNQNRDTAWFAIIDSDWKEIKRGYEKWLAEDNFDSNGKQRRSLRACSQVG